MKLTATQLRKIIKEEVQKARGRKTLAEGHSRIEAEELEAWKRGDWGYVGEASGGMMPGRDDRFMKPAKPPQSHNCESCGNVLSQDEIDAFRAEARTKIPGYPSVCDDCAEF